MSDLMIQEQLRDITAETDPNVMFRRTRMLVGAFEAADLDKVHAALMDALKTIVARAWLDGREGEPPSDAVLCERMEAELTRALILVNLAAEPHGDFGAE